MNLDKEKYLVFLVTFCSTQPDFDEKKKVTRS